MGGTGGRGDGGTGRRGDWIDFNPKSKIQNPKSKILMTSLKSKVTLVNEGINFLLDKIDGEHFQIGTYLRR